MKDFEIPSETDFSIDFLKNIRFDEQISQTLGEYLLTSLSELVL